MIDNKIIEILQNQIIIENNTISLKQQLDKKLYSTIKEIFIRLGGIWNNKTNTHNFEYGPSIMIDKVIKNKEMPTKNPTAFFPTPRKLVEDMIRVSDFSEYKDLKILEPSAGIGGIADIVKEQFNSALNSTIDVVEILEDNQNILKSKGYNPHCMEFEKFTNDYKYNYVFMNPPFSINGNRTTYISHVIRAYEMLDYMGTLVAIIPTGFLRNTSKKEKEFFDLVFTKGELYHNESNSFKHVGTNVDTVTIVLHEGSNWKESEYNGYSSHIAWNFILCCENNSQLNKKLQEIINHTTLASSSEIESYLDNAYEVFKKELVYFPYSYKDQFKNEIIRRWKIENEVIEDNSTFNINTFIKQQVDVVKDKKQVSLLDFMCDVA